LIRRYNIRYTVRTIGTNFSATSTRLLSGLCGTHLSRLSKKLTFKEDRLAQQMICHGKAKFPAGRRAPGILPVVTRSDIRENARDFRRDIQVFPTSVFEDSAGHHPAASR
jgi:hypothetical protein